MHKYKPVEGVSYVKYDKYGYKVQDPKASEEKPATE